MEKYIYRSAQTGKNTVGWSFNVIKMIQQMKQEKEETNYIKSCMRMVN